MSGVDLTPEENKVWGVAAGLFLLAYAGFSVLAVAADARDGHKALFLSENVTLDNRVKNDLSRVFLMTNNAAVREIAIEDATSKMKSFKSSFPKSVDDFVSASANPLVGDDFKVGLQPSFPVTENFIKKYRETQAQEHGLNAPQPN